MSKIKDNLLSLNNLRKYTGFAALNQAIKSDFKLEIYNDMPAANVLVLSPHPDDDAIGCGGTLRLHANNGASIKTVVLTDGSGGKGKISKDIEKKLVATRESETKKAGEILGIDDLIFWRYKDGKLMKNKTTVKLLSTLISDFKPDIIYAPSFLDPHPDHLETAKILQEALKDMKYDGIIYSYEVWSPIYANRIISIDETIDKKELAILSHESQLKERSYFDAVMGLNRYRAGMYSAGNYAEAFLATNRDLYLKMFEIASLNSKMKKGA